jgi:replication factor A1
MVSSELPISLGYLELIDRYDSAGRNTQFNAYTSNSVARADGDSGPTRTNEIKTIGEAKDENLGMRDKTDYFTTAAVVAFIKSESFSYPACANPDGCNKKVVEEGNGNWVCEKCNKHWPAPIHR